MKVFITGASGYVGNRLAITLAERGNEVQVIVRSLSALKILQHSNMTVFTGDILDKKSLRKAMEGCGQVYHVAGLVKNWDKDPSAFFNVNVEGTRNVLDIALECGVGKFVFTSSCGVIGPSVNEPMTENDPRVTGFDNDYELSKSLAEKVVIGYNNDRLSTVIASSSKVFGPGIDTHPMSVNGVIRRLVTSKLTLCPNPSSFISNYVFIDDLVNGHILAMAKGQGGQKYILGGENLSFAEFFQTIRQVSGKNGWLIKVPKSFGRLYGHWHFIKSKLQGKEPFFISKAVNQIFCNKSFSSSKAIHHLGYTITPFAEALKPTLQFLNKDNHE